MPGTYLDFDLQIEQTAAGYRAQVLSSPAGPAARDWTLPFADLEIENFLLKLGRAQSTVRGFTPPEVAAARDFGRRLFNAVFANGVLECLGASLREAGRVGAGLRIRLRLSGAPALADLPWEYLYHPAQNRFLALSVETPVVRYLDVPERRGPLALTPPLRILVMMASPRDFPPLDVEREWANMQEALHDLTASGRVTLERLREPTLPALLRQLRHGPYHIWHFMGHGAFDPVQEDGVIMLEDAQGRGYGVRGADLGTILSDHAPLRLAVLNSCEGARSSRLDPFAGTAQGLIGQGIPAAIAMQFAITDQAAVTFGREFYGALADNYPVDAALAEARKAIYAAGHLLEWGTPVLHLRVADGRLFEVAPPQTGSQGAAPAPPTPVSQPPAQPDPAARPQAPMPARRIFISCRDGAPDGEVAGQIAAALGADHTVFLDPAGPAGAAWAGRVEAALHEADVLIPVLSAAAVDSEMLRAEVHRAADQRTQQGRPRFLPVRLAYGEPFPYPLSAYLEGCDAAVWNGPADTPRLLADLAAAIRTGTLPPQPAPAGAAPPAPASAPPPPVAPLELEMPEGTMDPQSAFYVERPADARALATIRQKGVTLTIKGPRQMGKSSLLMRTMKAAADAGKRVAFLDFQLFDTAALKDAETFLRQFCTLLSHKLKIPNQVATYWSLPLGNIQRCTAYLEDYLLPELDWPLVLAMDEVDKIFDAEFRSDFFGMLRAWHNDRQGLSVWKNLDLALVTSTEPYQLIENLNQSPFNVGQVIELEDLTPAQVSDLNRRHGRPFTPDEERRLITLLGGQPYLTRRALYLVASGEIPAAALFARAAEDRGPFGDHLRYHFFRMHDKAELVAALRTVLRSHSSPDERLFFRLRGAGLVRREGGAVVPRNQLYADYFREHLGG